MSLPPATSRPAASAKPLAENGCLSAISPAALALLRPHLVETVLTEGTLIWDPGSLSQDAFFPVSGIISVIVPFSTGESIEVASVGSEAAGSPQFAPYDSATRGCVFVGGTFLRMPSAQLLTASRHDTEIARLVQICRDWILAQSQQIAACNAVHSGEQRLCRWLTQTYWRLAGGRVHATQDSIGTALGIRRTTVTLLAQTLQVEGLIQYRRGTITISDPARVEQMACECCKMLDKKHWPSIRLRNPDK